MVRYFTSVHFCLPFWETKLNAWVLRGRYLSLSCGKALIICISEPNVGALGYVVYDILIFVGIGELLAFEYF